MKVRRAFVTMVASLAAHAACFELLVHGAHATKSRPRVAPVELTLIRPPSPHKARTSVMGPLAQPKRAHRDRVRPESQATKREGSAPAPPPVAAAPVAPPPTQRPAPAAVAPALVASAPPPSGPQPLSSLSRRPELRGECPPGNLRELYTAEALRRGIEGRVVVEVLVLEDGSVGDARVKKGLGFGLDEVAVTALRGSCRFLPAEKDGRAVSTIIRYTFTFILSR